MRLRRSVLSKPGIARKRRGKGFAYYGPDGNLLSDPQNPAAHQGIGHSATAVLSGDEDRTGFVKVGLKTKAQEFLPHKNG